MLVLTATQSFYCFPSIMAYIVNNIAKQKQIFQSLTLADDVYSLPVRGMTEFILSGKIPTGQLFVNDFDNFSSVAALHEMSEYSKLDMDVLTIFSKDAATFQPFFKSLAEIRQWDSRGILVIFIRPEFIEISKLVLHKLKCDDLGEMYLSYCPTNTCLEFVNDVDNVKILPNGMTMEPCKVKDVELIIPTWNHGVPDSENMLRWNIKNFPSSSIRTSDDRPIAWLLTYSAGCGGPFYVEPEYRRLGYGEIVSDDIIRRHYHFGYLCPRYGGIAPTNEPSLALYAKPKSKFITVNALANWLVFSQHEKAKL